jgi:hypothetical protein
MLVIVCGFLVSNRFLDPEIKTAEQAKHADCWRTVVAYPT